MSDLSRILTGLAGAAGAVAPFLPAGAQPAVAAVAAALGLAADLADAGHDPVVEIARIRRVHPMLAGVEAEWDARLREKFQGEEFYEPDATGSIVPKDKP